MENWNSASVRRLYELYLQHDRRLRGKVAATNRSLGSPHPNKIKLDRLTQTEFEAILRDPKADPETNRLWVRRIIRGHEQEFPTLRAAS